MKFIKSTSLRNFNILSPNLLLIQSKKMVCYGVKSDENDTLIPPPTHLLRSKSYNRSQVALESNISLSIYLRVLFRGSHIYNGPIKVVQVVLGEKWH